MVGASSGSLIVLYYFLSAATTPTGHTSKGLCSSILTKENIFVIMSVDGVVWLLVGV